VALRTGPGRLQPSTDLEILPHTIGVFVILQDGHVYGRLPESLGRCHAVVAGNRSLQGDIVPDDHPDAGLAYGVAVVGHGIADVHRAFGSGRCNKDAATGLAHVGVQAGVSFNAIGHDPDQVTIRISVVGGSVHGNLPARTDLDFVIHRSRLLVVFTARCNPHCDSSCVDGSLAVNPLVSERIGTCTVACADEIDEVATRRRGSHAGCAVDAGELDRVAVGVDR